MNHSDYFRCRECRRMGEIRMRVVQNRREKPWVWRTVMECKSSKTDGKHENGHVVWLLRKCVDKGWETVVPKDIE